MALTFAELRPRVYAAYQSVQRLHAESTAVLKEEPYLRLAQTPAMDGRYFFVATFVSGSEAEVARLAERMYSALKEQLVNESALVEEPESDAYMYRIAVTTA